MLSKGADPYWRPICTIRPFQSVHVRRISDVWQMGDGGAKKGSPSGGEDYAFISGLSYAQTRRDLFLSMDTPHYNGPQRPMIRPNVSQF